MFNAAIFTSRGNSQITPTGTPVLSNFRIENAEPSKVYFDSSSDITGLSATGFTISGKTISSVSVNGTSTTGHYFTVSEPFTYWDNNTIRLGENTDIYAGTQVNPKLPNFTLEYIENNINEPVSTQEKYVTANASGSGDGSEGNPWTLAQSMTLPTPGTTVWIKAGNYGAGQYRINPSTPATPTNPVKYKGYTSVIGDLDSDYIMDDFVYTTPAAAETYIDDTKFPVIEGTNQASSSGLFLRDEENIIIKNIQIKKHYYNLWLYLNCGNVHVENVTTAVGVVTSNGYGIYSSQPETNNFRVKKCLSFDNGGNNYSLAGTFNLLLNNASYNGTTSYYTDYLTQFYRLNNSIAKGNYIEVLNHTYSGNHGMGIKNSLAGFTSQYNLFVENNMINVRGEGYFMAHSGTSHNVVKRNNGTQGRFLIARNAAHDNIFENNYGSSVLGAIKLWANIEEEPFASGTVADSNLFINNIFNGVEHIVTHANASSAAYNLTNNKVLHNTFYNATNIIYDSSTNLTFSGNEFKGNIVHTASNLYGWNNNSPWSFTDNDFYLTPAVAGTGNISINPNFVDSVDFEPQEAGLIVAPKIAGVDYDYNGGERASTTTIGAVKHANEIVGGGTNYDYYVSATGTGDGTSEATPMSFAAAQTAITTMTAGETMAFKGGDKFSSTMTINGVVGTAQNPITFTSYGTGKALFDHSVPVTGWTNEGGNIWSKSIGSPVYQVFKNGNHLEVASSPWYSVSSVIEPQTSVIVNELIGRSALHSSAVVMLQTYIYNYQIRSISNFNTGTGQITYAGTLYPTSEGRPTKINNDPLYLISQDDWFFDYTTNTLKLYSTTEPSNITVAIDTRDAFNIDNSDYLTFDNLAIERVNNSGINMKRSDYITVTNCDIKYAYNKGIENVDYDNASVGFTATNNVVDLCSTGGINNRWASGTITHNQVRNIGLITTSTTIDRQFSVAITNGGGNYNNDVTPINGGITSYNVVEDVAYNGISFGGINSVISKNVIINPMSELDDGGGIYCYSGTIGNRPKTGSVIEDNLILYNAQHDNYGGNLTSAGIYLDEGSAGITVQRNSIYGGTKGIFQNTTSEISILNNNVLIHNDGSYDVIGLPTNHTQTNVIDVLFSGNNVLMEASSPNSYPTYVYQNVDLADNQWLTFTNNFMYNAYIGDYQYHTNLGGAISNYRISEFETYWDLSSGNTRGDAMTPVAGYHSRLLYNDTDQTANIAVPSGTWYDLSENVLGSTVSLGAYQSIIITDVPIGDGQNYSGINILVNGTFDTDSDWSKTSATISGGVATINVVDGATANIQQSVTLTSGNQYRLTVDIVGDAGNNIRFADNAGNLGGLSAVTTNTALTGSLQQLEFFFTANANSNIIQVSRASAGTYSFTVDNILLEEL